MSKTISARIDDDLYDEISKMKKSNTKIIRNALLIYLDHSKNNNIETRLQPVNKEIFEDKYQTLTRIIDKHLNGD